MITLDHWSVQQGAYRAPELGFQIVGRRPDGKTVITSTVVETHGRVMRTMSGSLYRLGAVDPKYAAFLRNMGKPETYLPVVRRRRA